MTADILINVILVSLFYFFGLGLSLFGFVLLLLKGDKEEVAVCLMIEGIGLGVFGLFLKYSLL